MLSYSSCTHRHVYNIDVLYTCTYIEGLSVLVTVFTLHPSGMNLKVTGRHDLHALLLSVPSYFGLNPAMKEFLRFRNKNIGKMALDCDGSGALTLVMKALYQLTAEQMYTFEVEST